MANVSFNMGPEKTLGELTTSTTPFADGTLHFAYNTTLLSGRMYVDAKIGASNYRFPIHSDSAFCLLDENGHDYDMGDANRPIYFAVGKPQPIDYLSTRYGGTGLISFTANRLMWASSASVLTTSAHYVDADHIAINSETKPDYNFYINGTSGFANGHIYLTGANKSSSTSNTTQIVFGTPSENHLAISSNEKALVLNPTTSSTTNQIVLYLEKQSIFPAGLETGADSTIGGSLSVTNRLSVDGNATIDGNLDVGGNITAANLKGNSDSADKVNHDLIAGTKRYNGSADVTITAADLGLSNAMKFIGITTSALTDGSTNGTIVVNGSNVAVTNGNVVLYDEKEFVWTGSSWELLGDESSYKIKQTAVASPSTSGNATAFIDSITQNANGVITATKKNVTFPTLSGGSASTVDTTIVGGVTVSGHAVTVQKKTLVASNAVTITGTANTITISSTDTKNTAGATNSASKIFLIGAPSQADNPQTYSNSKVYATDGVLTADVFSGSLGHTTLGANSEAVDFNDYYSTKGLKVYAVSSNAAVFNGPLTTSGQRYSIFSLPLSTSQQTQLAIDGNRGVHIRTGNASTGGDWSHIVTTANVNATGGTAQPIYIDASGRATALSATVGDVAAPTYLKDGVITACTMATSGNWWGTLSNIGTNGVIEVGRYIDFHYTDASTNDYDLRIDCAGNSKNVLYLPAISGQVVVHTNDTAVGGTAKPVYIAASGQATALSATAGGTAQPVYLNAGTITACSGNIGSASLPVYMSNGTITACTASSLFSALSWSAGTTAGPTLNATIAGQPKSAQIPSASSSASGIVTTGSQTFAGAKTFNGNVTIKGQASFQSKIIVDADSYGTSLPSTGVEGQVFFLLIE